MDLADIIDYFLPRLSPRKIRYIARMSWGRPKNLRDRVYIRLLIAPVYGIRTPRTYVLFNAMSDLLKKR